MPGSIREIVFPSFETDAVTSSNTSDHSKGFCDAAGQDTIDQPSFLSYLRRLDHSPKCKAAFDSFRKEDRKEPSS